MAKAGEIAEVSGNAVASRPFEKFAEYANQRAAVESENIAEVLSQEQMDRILSAKTPEELDEAMSFGGLIALKDLNDGQELQIDSFRFAPGSRAEFANQIGVFAIINATNLENGANLVIDTGIERILAWLRMCEAHDRFPVKVRVAKTPTARGEAVTLLPLRKRAIEGKSE